MLKRLMCMILPHSVIIEARLYSVCRVRCVRCQKLFVTCDTDPGGCVPWDSEWAATFDKMRNPAAKEQP